MYFYARSEEDAIVYVPPFYIVFVGKMVSHICNVPRPLLSSFLSRTAWLSRYANESDFIMLFSLIRTWRNKYFLCPYLLRGAAFLKGELALQTWYRYLFWYGGGLALITRPSQKCFNTFFFFRTRVRQNYVRQGEESWSFWSGVECGASSWNSIFKTVSCLRSGVNVVGTHAPSCTLSHWKERKFLLQPLSSGAEKKCIIEGLKHAVKILSRNCYIQNSIIKKKLLHVDLSLKIHVKRNL